MIIIEGADGSGKSTLKYQLKKDLGLVDVSFTKVDPIDKRQEMALRSPKDTKDMITDRSFFLSELVYSQLLRGFNIPQTIWIPLYRKLYEGHLIIICTGQGEEVRKDYDSDEEVWKKTQETKQQARDLYLTIAKELGTFMYNFDFHSYLDIRSLVINYMESFNERI